MRAVRAAAAVALSTQLAGCFFVFIPGSLIAQASDAVTGARGDHCVSSSAKVGDRIRLPDGREGSVASLSGTSTRCQQAGLPIRAELSF